MTRQTVTAYWLIPSEPAYSLFQRIISDLAGRYHAPVFEPHLTIHVGADRGDVAKDAIENAARECKFIRLTKVGIHHSQEFIKTLFVQFALSAELQAINERIRSAADDSCHYKLNPHLSLLYKKVTTASRSELAASINLPFPEVTFDTIKALRCVSPTKSALDVKAWHVLAAASLCEGRV